MLIAVSFKNFQMGFLLKVPRNADKSLLTLYSLHYIDSSLCSSHRIRINEVQLLIGNPIIFMSFSIKSYVDMIFVMPDQVNRS